MKRLLLLSLFTLNLMFLFSQLVVWREGEIVFDIENENVDSITFRQFNVWNDSLVVFDSKIADVDSIEFTGIPVPDSIDILYDTVYLSSLYYKYNDTLELKVKVFPTAYKQKVIWSKSADAKFSLSENGLLNFGRIGKDGMSTIYAEVEGLNLIDSCVVVNVVRELPAEWKLLNLLKPKAGYANIVVKSDSSNLKLVEFDLDADSLLWDQANIYDFEFLSYSIIQSDVTATNEKWYIATVKLDETKKYAICHAPIRNAHLWDNVEWLGDKMAKFDTLKTGELGLYSLENENYYLFIDTWKSELYAPIVKFNLYSEMIPTGARVGIVGDMNNWNLDSVITMELEKENHYSISVNVLAACKYKYVLDLDGNGYKAENFESENDRVIAEKCAIVTDTVFSWNNMSQWQTRLLRPDVEVIFPTDKQECNIGEYVRFDVELHNPNNLEVEYTWYFPGGTYTESGDLIESFVGENPTKIRFNAGGIKNVRLETKLGGVRIKDVNIRIDVLYDKLMPTLYYAEKGGNLMALKFDGDEVYEPIDLGLKSGDHAFNILKAGMWVCVIDAGKKFMFLDDPNHVYGDGCVRFVSLDGRIDKVLLTNFGGLTHRDPYFGFSDPQNSFIFVSDRNTGFYKLSILAENDKYSEDKYFWHVKNDLLGYYGKGLSYGALNACFGKINDTWHWCKIYNGHGIFRFLDSDILQSSVESLDEVPESGVVLAGIPVKSFVYDEKNDKFYFSCIGEHVGLYCCKYSELESINSENIKDYALKFNGEMLPIIKDRDDEGGYFECIGICQMALDEATGNVYFGLRSGDDKVPSGLYRYNAKSGVVECVIEGVEIYGVTINKEASYLF